MTEVDAHAKTDTILLAMVTNQQELFGKSNMTSPGYAKNLAESVAAFRKELIDQLMTQPG